MAESNSSSIFNVTEYSLKKLLKAKNKQILFSTFSAKGPGDWVMQVLQFSGYQPGKATSFEQ